MKKCKISPATLARTAALALALTNQVLSATGHRVLPIESAELEQLVSTGLTIATALVSWWKNNSFTPEAIEADEGAQITNKGRCCCGIVPFWLSAFVLKHRLRKWHPRPTSCGRHPRHPV